MAEINGSPLATLPVVVLSGTASQRGQQHGRMFAGRISILIAKMKESYSPAALNRARENAYISWTNLRDRTPEVAEEIAGIASGANCDFIDIYCYIGFEFFDICPASGCSGLAITSTRGAVLGQNWDAAPEMHSDLAFFLHVGGKGLDLAVVASIGTLGWVGVNRSGVGLLTNDVMLDKSTSGMPSQVVRRLLLAEGNVSSAVETLKQLPIMGGRSYLLGDCEGFITGVELSPSAGVCELPNASRIFHTNHALLAATRAFEDEGQLQGFYPSSHSRLVELKRAGEDATGVGDLMRALADRTNAPDAVSKTVSDRENTRTAFSIIIDCGQRELYLCAGPPSEGRYQRFHLPDVVAESAEFS
ncbi:C45 family peptidase [Mesorhizobium sp. WSM3862]|uniref:C45 family autoproteolytic acyltransferase/hydolase n=1 Tax=Mesorhizobium sp. WSM3862 TaxID=632858 RepID=UPI0011410036|nr:C45 family peptidase [Mesorhizobium sp. WSM3862]